jgi:predicted Zn-dependent protease
VIPGLRPFNRSALGAVCFAVASCATTDLSPIGAGGKPVPTDEDEKQLWRNSEQLERRIDNSEIRYKNPQLDAYLTNVAQGLLPREVQVLGLAPRVKVIQNPLLNAFALPNGAIYFHTGILARMENEDQLAAVLGHELTHFTHRHAVKQMRSLQNQANFFGVFQVMLPGLEGLTGQIGALWTLASTSGYSRGLETEADEQGLREMVKAGYDPKQAPAVIKILEEDLDEQKVKEPFFFGTHPRLQERIANYRRLLDTEYANQARAATLKVGAQDFLAGADALPLDNAVLDINLGRLKTARSAIEKHLKRHPQAPRAHFLLGEVYRRTGSGELYAQQAIAEYQEAAREDSGYSDPHRELGLLYRRRGLHQQARAEFERYLALSPNSTDAPIIQGYLKEPQKPEGKISVGGKSVD